MDPLDAHTHRQRTVYAKRYKYTSMCESIKIQIVQTCERALCVHQLPNCCPCAEEKQTDGCLFFLSPRFCISSPLASLRLLNLFNRIFRFRCYFFSLNARHFKRNHKIHVLACSIEIPIKLNALPLISDSQCLLCIRSSWVCLCMRIFSFSLAGIGSLTCRFAIFMAQRFRCLVFCERLLAFHLLWFVFCFYCTRGDRSSLLLFLLLRNDPDT